MIKIFLNQNYEKWSSGEKLKNELEVVGFYFSDHPLNIILKNFLKYKILIILMMYITMKVLKN